MSSVVRSRRFQLPKSESRPESSGPDLFRSSQSNHKRPGRFPARNLPSASRRPTMPDSYT